MRDREQNDPANLLNLFRSLLDAYFNTKRESAFQDDSRPPSIRSFNQSMRYRKIDPPMGPNFKLHPLYCGGQLISDCTTNQSVFVVSRGVITKRINDHCIVRRDENFDYWFGNAAKQLYRLD